MSSSMLDRPPPSAWAIAIATAIVSGLAGYFLGQATSIGVFNTTLRTRGVGSTEDESDAEDDVKGQQELGAFSGNTEECKLVLVVRTDLGMTKGKIAAQCGHATLACYKMLAQDSTASSVLKRWERDGQTKVAVQAKSEQDLEELQATAMSLGICAHIIHDAGRTQIASGSATVLGVGPAPRSVVDQVTSHLKLL